MRVQDVQARLERIEAIKEDDEVAHSLQDDLFRTVLQHIADGGRNCGALAREALKVNDIDFARWMA